MPITTEENIHSITVLPNNSETSFTTLHSNRDETYTSGNTPINPDTPANTLSVISEINSDIYNETDNEELSEVQNSVPETNKNNKYVGFKEAVIGLCTGSHRPYNQFFDDLETTAVRNNLNIGCYVDCVQYNIFANCLASTFLFCLSLHLYVLVLCLIIFVFVGVLVRIRYYNWFSQKLNFFLHTIFGLNLICFVVIFVVYHKCIVLGTASNFIILAVMTGILFTLLAFYKITVYLGKFNDYLSLRNVEQAENKVLIWMMLYLIFSSYLFSCDIFESTVVISMHYSSLMLIFILNSIFMIFKLVSLAKWNKEFIAVTFVAAISIIMTIVTSIYGFKYRLNTLAPMSNHL